MRVVRCALYTGLMLAMNGVAWADSDGDPTWDPPGGYTVTQIGAADAVPNAIGIDSIGRVVLAGYSYATAQGDPQFTAVRYLGDTSLNVGFEDPNFKNGLYDGIATATVGINGAYGNALQFNGDDGVVVAGDCTNPTMGLQYPSICLARFTPTGALDPTWGNNSNGTTITTVGTSNAYAKAMTTDPNTGAFLVAGYSFATGPAVFTVARYNGSGFQDGSFGSSGFAKLADPGGGDAQALAIAVDSVGRIVVAGVVADSTYPLGAFAIARFDNGGGPDMSFNGGQMFVTQLGQFADYVPLGYNFSHPFFALAIDASDRPVIAAAAYPPSAPPGVGLIRMTTAGALDGTFAGGGKTIVSLPNCSDTKPSGIQIDRGGQYFVSAQCQSTTYNQNVVALAHFGPNGHLDTAYAPNGYDAKPFGAEQGPGSGGLAVALDALGRPMVAAYDYRQVSNSILSGFAVFRHDYIYSQGFE